MNGKPPGKTENEAGDAVPTEIGASAHAELSAETPEVTNGAGDAAADVAEDPALSEELTTEAVTEQLQDLALNPTTTADDIPENADESSEDDGDGEWISRFSPHHHLQVHSLTKISQRQATSKSTRPEKMHTQPPKQHNGYSKQP